MKLPKNETPFVRYLDGEKNERFIITANLTSGLFYLYERNGNEYNRIGKGNPSPLELERKHGVLEAVGIGGL